jgi:two-component system, NarL family, response regulator DevR
MASASLSEYSYPESRNFADMTAAARLGTLRPMKVFLVEDSPILRSRLEGMLSAIPGAQSVGYAEGADDAVRDILATRPDVVVLDIHLKQGNGFDIMRAVTQAAPEIAFYVLTNHPAGGYRTAAERLGARGFFDKSSEFERLREVLGKLPA